MANAFISLFVSGVSGTVTALLLFLFRKGIRKYFPAKWLYYMWIAILVIMLIPVRFTLPELQKGEQPNKNAFSTNEVLKADASDVKNSDTFEVTENTSAIRNRVTENSDAVIRNTVGASVIYKKIADILPFLAGIWLFAATALFLFRVITYYGFRSHIMRSSTEAHLPEIKEYADRNITVRTSREASSPFIIGVIRPVLILPKCDLTDENIRYILHHEMIHLKRFDIPIKWFALAVKCIHFYNPMVYLICDQLSKECEISCDAEVVKDMSDTEKRSYMETILMLLQKCNSTKLPLTTGITESKEFLKTRFILIKNSAGADKKKLTFSVVIFTAVIVVSLLISGLAADFIKLPEKPDAALSSVTEIGVPGVYGVYDVHEARISSIDLSSIELLDKNGEHIMSIPVSVAEGFPAFKAVPGKVPFEIYCGKIDNFFWAGVTTKGVMSKSHTNICTSSDGGKNWYVKPDGYFGKGIVERIWFVSETEGYISYSGGGYGKGISKTSDGGVTWEHFMEHNYSLPLSEENALKLLKHQLIYAYTQKYGYYTPIYDNPRSGNNYPGDEIWLPYVIEHLEITSDDGEYYTVPVIWDFKIEKSTGFIFKFYDGHHKALMPFDPYSPDALSFAG